MRDPNSQAAQCCLLSSATAGERGTPTVLAFLSPRFFLNVYRHAEPNVQRSASEVAPQHRVPFQWQTPDFGLFMEFNGLQTQRAQCHKRHGSAHPVHSKTGNQWEAGEGISLEQSRCAGQKGYTELMEYTRAPESSNKERGCSNKAREPIPDGSCCMMCRGGKGGNNWKSKMKHT